MQLVTVPNWSLYGWLLHGFSTRAGGVSSVYGPAELNLGFTKEDERTLVERNRELLLAAVRSNAASLVTLRQVHSARTLSVSAPGSAGEADGLLTSTPGLILGIQTADCVPVLVADIRQRVAAGFHAGWRGAAASIVGHGIAQLSADFGSDPTDLIAAIGPAIGACCYTVGELVQGIFHANFPYAAELFHQTEAGLHLDLAEANRRQLLGAGLTPERVTVIAECTGCSRIGGRRKFFSHRAERGFTGRMMSVIGIAPT